MDNFFDSLGKVIESVVQVSNPLSFAALIMTLALILVARALRLVPKRQIYNLVITILALCFGLALVGLLLPYH